MGPWDVDYFSHGEIQSKFHQNLKNMRETARMSILSLNDRSARSTMYGRESDSQSPMLRDSAPKASGLRHYLARDDGSDYDDGVVMQPSSRGQDENRF